MPRIACQTAHTCTMLVRQTPCLCSRWVLAERRHLPMLLHLGQPMIRCRAPAYLHLDLMLRLCTLHQHRHRVLHLHYHPQHMVLQGAGTQGRRGSLWEEAKVGKTVPPTTGRGLGRQGRGEEGYRGAFWEISSEMTDNGTRGMVPHSQATNLRTFLLTPWGAGWEGGWEQGWEEGSAMRPTRKVVAMAMRMVDGMGLGAWGTWAWGTWVVRPGQTTLPTAAGALVIDPAGTPEIFAANAAMPAEDNEEGGGEGGRRERRQRRGRPEVDGQSSAQRRAWRSARRAADKGRGQGEGSQARC